MMSHRMFYGVMNAEKLMKMAGAVRIGGKGSMRRYGFDISSFDFARN
ncbi:hypothetical protein HanHA300_Chr13g0499831 [Helianthus annuus]|nr:hypothetical protein HanHA300_Chr13g0499831 [Helianthus annuus]